MNLELLLDLYAEITIDGLAYSRPVTEYGYRFRNLVTERGAQYWALELSNTETDHFPITFWTDKALSMPGWIAGFRPLDLVVFEHAKGVDVFPFLLLRRAWVLNGKQWCKDYKPQREKRDGFEHQFVMVPRSLVLRTSQQGMMWDINTEGEACAAS